MKYFLLCLLLTLFSCSSTVSKNYPKSWWQPVAKSELKWWEIGPDAAGKGEVILSKRNELGILSNFAHTPFQLDGKTYQSVEGFWQSMKFPETRNDYRWSKSVSWSYSRDDVEKMVGHKAKKAGSEGSKNMKRLGIDWVTYKGVEMAYHTKKKGPHYQVIRRAMIAKLKQNKKVKDILLSTGDLVLKPDHKTKPTDPPAWKYYQIWMELRSLLQKGKPLQ